jgi:probable biosynthetic protein (TIGR04098 family)
MFSDPDPHAAATEATVQVGMPQLGLNGLSENWLLKEAGHRHWTAICSQAGIESHQITDPQGNRLYAAFVGIELEGDPLGMITENELLRVDTSLARFSSKRFFSRNEFRSASGASTVVQMVSIFVKKPVFDDNRSLAGGHPDPLRAIPQTDAPSKALDMLERWKHHKTTPPADPREGHVHRQSVCPTTDFNGARLLYFANFQHMLDQAEWFTLNHDRMQFASSEVRRLYFYGNVNFDDVVEVRFRNVDWEGDVRTHDADIVRQRDGSRLAVVETRKRITVPSRDF